jgi:3D (Asp-Asp-Asp) domain-containing protein
MKAIYPMVGASSAACAQNLKSSSFTGTFSSGWTFASTGVTPNGSSAFMNTFLNPSIESQRNSSHISVYLRTNNDALMCDMGGAVMGSEVDIFSKLTNLFYPRCNSPANAGVTNNVSSLGLFISNRITSSEIRAWRNNNLSVLSDTSQLPPNSNIYVGALRNDGASTTSFYSNRQNAFASIGDGLTDTQASDFYTAVQTFQTTLSRQV